MRFITQLVTLIMFLFSVPTALFGCSCGGPSNGDLCENIDTSFHHVALLKLVDSIDYNLRKAIVIDNLNPGRGFTNDTIIIVGADGANCNEELYFFALGDTFLMALNPAFFAPDTIEEYYDLGGCNRMFADLENDTLRFFSPNRWIDYDDFRLDALSCFEQNGVINTREQVLDAAAVDLFPNPAFDRISSSAPDLDILQIDLFDLSGRRVNSITSTNTSIDISDLSPNVYLARITTNQGIITKRFVKSPK